MNWNEFLEKMYLATVKGANVIGSLDKDDMLKQNKEGKTELVIHASGNSELQKTFEYISDLRKKYKPEIRLSFLVSTFFFFYLLVRELTTLVLASYLVALLFDPVLKRIESYGTSRTKAVIGLYALIIVVVLTLLSIFIPRLSYETFEFLRAVPAYAESGFQKVKDFSYEAFKIELSLSPVEVKRYVASITEGKTLSNLKPFLDPLWNTLFAGYNFTLSLINLCLFPFLVFYICRDWVLINRFLGNSIPSSYKESLFPFFREVQFVIAGYARGQIIVAMLLTIAYSSALLLLDVRFALPLGVFAGILSVVPYLGYFTGFTLALLVQLVNDGTMNGIIKLVLAFLIIQIIEGNFVTPRVLGESTGLHPLIVILSLIIGGTLFGFLGLLLGIPAAAILKLVMQRVLKPL